MANLAIHNRMNVIEFLRSKSATKMDFVKSKSVYKDGGQKFFFALNNSEKSVVDGREIIGTRGAISESLAKDISAGKQLNLNEVMVADTTLDGSSTHVWMLIRAGEGNSVGGFSL